MVWNSIQMGFQKSVSQFDKMALLKIVELLINYGGIFKRSELDFLDQSVDKWLDLNCLLRL